MNHFNGNFAKAFPERVTIRNEAMAKHAAAMRAADPYSGLLDDGAAIVKAEHAFEEKQRITFKHNGVEHHGRISAINARGLLVVRTDSGHTLLVHPSNDEAEPEDFPQGGDGSSDKMLRATDAANNQDPYPGLNVLAKSPGGATGFHVGQRVRDRLLQRNASITGIDEFRKVMKITYADGSDGECVLDRAAGCFEIL